MNKICLVILISVFSTFSYSHSGADPIKELKKNHHRLSAMQNEFESLKDLPAQFDSLNNQAKYLQKNVLILRNLMAKDYPHISEGMSKYKLDYMEELEDSLVELKRTISLMKDAITD